MYSPLKIALVEDHASLRKVLAQVLRQHGHHVFELACAEDMETVLGGEAVQLYILDLSLPGEDGLQLSKRLRALQPQVGIIMLTGRFHASQVGEGYRSGADVYLIKPIGPDVLLAAIESVQRRMKQSSSPEHIIKLDTVTRSLVGPGGTVDLTQAETAVLIGLLRSPHRALDIYQIGELLGQPEDAINKASLEVRLVRLRAKLHGVGAGTSALKHHRDLGYQLGIPMQIH